MKTSEPLHSQPPSNDQESRSHEQKGVKRNGSGFYLASLICLLCGFVVNQVASKITEGRWLSLGDVKRLFHLAYYQWPAYARSVWILPASWLLMLSTLSLALAFCAWALRSKKASIRVYGLVCERGLHVTYGLLFGLLASQISLYGTAMAYAAVFVYPHPLLLSKVGIVASSFVFVIWGLIFFGIALRTIYRSLFVGTLLSCKLAAQFWRNETANYRTVLPTKAPESCDILVVSDLHITAHDEVTLEGAKETRKTLEFLRKAVERTKPKLILCCGDVTDTGDAAAWARLDAVIKDIGIPFVCIPGNHDYHFKRMAANQGSFWSYIKSFLDLLSFKADTSFSTTEVVSHVRKTCLIEVSTFPHLLHDQNVGVDLLLLDSNMRASSSPITNAIGLVGKPQLDVAVALLEQRATKTRPLIILVHHHIAPPLSVGRAGRLFLRCLDSQAVLSLARKFGSRLILHGHLHMPYVQIGSPTIASCGSATFEPQGPFKHCLPALPTAMALSVSEQHTSIYMLN